MKLISAFAAALALCGRHGTLIAAASIFIGLAVPVLAAAFRPHLGEAIVVMLTLAFLRVDPVELRRHWTQPGLIAAATIWTMLILPAVLGTLFLAFKLDQKMPGLYFMLVLQMSAPGLMSSPALAALLGLDVALTLATLIVATVVTPFTASLFTHVFLGTALASPLEFGFRLFLIIVGCALAATIIRLIAGAKIYRGTERAIDGLSVIAMSMFAIAAMDGAMDHFRADPKPGNQAYRACIPACTRFDRRYRDRVPTCRTSACLRDRPDRRKPKRRSDAGCNRLRDSRYGMALFCGRTVSHLSAAALIEAPRQAPVSQSLTSRCICVAAALPVYPPRVRRNGIWRPQCPVR